MSDPKIDKTLIHKGTMWKQGMPEYYKNNLKPLYIPKVGYSQPVYIVEGEKCAHILSTIIGLVVTWCDTEAPEKTNWDKLTSQWVVIWPDNDNVGKKVANKVATILKQIAKKIEIIDIDALNLPEKADVVDWIKLNPNADHRNIWELKTIVIKDNGK